ncbi:MAG TPA: FecR domain-containing protein [Pyrinomonadaceae bacterium]|nr:FecR domain-containing protein [Pyrinomonadaceae bacterium]
MESKYRKIYVEWWKIQRSTIIGLIVFVCVTGAVVFGGWWAIKNNWFVPQENSDIPKNAARIISFEGEVRITRAATRETILVTKETHVAAGDTIQTQADGRAIVQMIDGSVYTVRPNSTVVIRDNSSLFGGNNVRVSLDDGQLNVRTDDQPANTENVVEMRDSETQIRSQTDASFNADDRVAEIRVSRGGVETTVGGAKTTITENEFASVDNGRLASKETLLAPPRLASPANLAQLVDAAGAGANVSLTWQDDGSTPLSGFYLQVARSSYFASDSILIDRSALTTRDFRVGGLSPGTYYWRVRSTARSGQASDWSEPWKFSVAKREASQSIQVAGLQVENVGGNVYILSGRTQPGVQVRALGNQVFAASDGSFRLQISTPLSETAVELSDDRGNRAGFVISLRTSKILRKF